jgi:hypothetical protein
LGKRDETHNTIVVEQDHQESDGKELHYLEEVVKDE